MKKGEIFSPVIRKLGTDNHEENHKYKKRKEVQIIHVDIPKVEVIWWKWKQYSTLLREDGLFCRRGNKVWLRNTLAHHIQAEILDNITFPLYRFT